MDINRPHVDQICKEASQEGQEIDKFYMRRWSGDMKAFSHGHHPAAWGQAARSWLVWEGCSVVGTSTVEPVDQLARGPMQRTYCSSSRPHVWERHATGSKRKGAEHFRKYSLCSKNIRCFSLFLKHMYLDVFK
jgi:hypothetical protein